MKKNHKRIIPLKSTFLLLLSLAAYSSLIAQESLVKFGEVIPNDFSLDYSHLDSTEDYIVQFEKATVSYDYNDNTGFSIVTLIQIRKHILKKSALNEGKVAIQYYAGTGVNSDFFEDIKATTYNFDGESVTFSQMDKKDIINEKVEDKYYNVKFNLTDVKVGSIIEYSYVRKTSLNLHNKPRTWYFQSKAPTLWSEFEADIPRIFYYQIIFGGYVPLTINSQEPKFIDLGNLKLNGEGIHYRFAVHNVPAFKNEKYITTNKDYLSKIEFELSSYQFPGQVAREFTSTWKDLDYTLKTSSNWGKNLKRTGYLSDIVDELKKLPTDEEKIEKAYAYMTKNFRWNGKQRLWSSENLRSVFDDKIGSATDLNLIYINLLRECNIEANPFILSTRKNGKINENFPLLDNFNYTLASVKYNEQQLFADVTNPVLPLGMIPEKCLNGIGREIGEKSSQFLEVTSSDGYSEYLETNIEMDLEEGLIKGTYKTENSGYSALEFRETYLKLGKTDFIKSLRESYADWDIEDFELENYDNLENKLTTSFKFQKEDNGIMSDILYLNPLIAGQITENPLKKDIRDYPVDFGSKTNKTAITKYQIPTGYILETIPPPVVLILPGNGGKFTFFVQVNGAELTILSRITINKPVFYAQEYPYLKEFYSKVVEKHAEHLVLKKDRD